MGNLELFFDLDLLLSDLLVAAHLLDLVSNCADNMAVPNDQVNRHARGFVEAYLQQKVHEVDFTARKIMDHVTAEYRASKATA